MLITLWSAHVNLSSSSRVGLVPGLHVVYKDSSNGNKNNIVRLVNYWGKASKSKEEAASCV